MSEVIVERSGGLAWVILNRPDKRNAIDYQTIEQLERILEEIKDNPDDQMLMITGAGERAFCSGGDLSIFRDLHTKKEAFSMLSKMSTILYELFFFPKPTVAVVNGTAVGGGCELATACDFRIASERAKMGFVQGTLGITTGWGGTTMLYERLPQALAMELLMTCKVFAAKEAFDFGFIQKLVPADADLKQACEEWAQPFLKQSGNVLKAYKKRFTDQFDKAKVKKQFLNEVDHCATLWETDDHHQAVKRFLDKSSTS